MDFPDPRDPRRGLPRPRPSLVDDFFAPHARPRALAGGPAPARLHPGSRLTGRPAHDSRPIGAPELAQAEFFIVKLRDGRPGLVLAADHTKVWTVPRVPQQHLRPAVATAPAQPMAPVSHIPQWWTTFWEAIQPKAGFILYANDSALPNAPDPNQFLRHGHVYGAIDVTLLKQAMDMSTSRWEKFDGPWNKPEDNLAWVLRFCQNAHATVDNSTTVAGAVQERLVSAPEVKLVVYSGYKTSLEEVERMRQAPDPAGTLNSGAGYERVTVKGGAAYDSLWQSNHYNEHGKLVGRRVARPSR